MSPWQRPLITPVTCHEVSGAAPAKKGLGLLLSQARYTFIGSLPGSRYGTYCVEHRSLRYFWSTVYCLTVGLIGGYSTLAEKLLLDLVLDLTQLVDPVLHCVGLGL
jgi:hypothetical protein